MVLRLIGPREYQIPVLCADRPTETQVILISKDSLLFLSTMRPLAVDRVITWSFTTMDNTRDAVVDVLSHLGATNWI